MEKGNELVQSIVTIDSYNQKYYKYDGSSIESLSKISFKKKNYYSSFIANRDLIISPITISRSIEDEDVDGALEDKAYDELGLDPATEYIIYHKEFQGEGEGRHFYLFIIEESKYEELFEPIVDQIKYIDLILPTPLIYQSLYSNNIVENRKVQCYLYFTKYDTTITFYKDGEYLYSKSINYSLQQIYDKYCAISGKTVDEKQFFQVFKNEGIKTTNPEFQENLVKLFNEIFITINDVVIYTKRAYKVDVIEQMFIGSELGPIAGVEEYAQNYLGLYSTAMDFDFGIESKEEYIDQIQYLMILATKEYQEEPDKYINFTRYPRPPAFVKRPSGQFILSMVTAIVLASSYPIYFLISSYLLNLNNYRLEKKEAKLSKEVKRYKLILGGKQRQIDRLNKEIERLKGIYTAKEKSLIAVYEKKVKYKLKSDQFASFAQDLAKFNVKSKAMISQNDNYKLNLIANSDRQITQLVKYVTKKYSNITKIDIDKIKQDGNNSSIYTGDLKVNLR